MLILSLFLLILLLFQACTFGSILEVSIYFQAISKYNNIFVLVLEHLENQNFFLAFKYEATAKSCTFKNSEHQSLISAPTEVF